MTARRAVAALALAGMLAGCGALSRPVADAILRTAEAGLGIVDAWCRPDVVDVDDDLCTSIRTWGAVGVHVLALVLPGFVRAELGAPDAAAIPAPGDPDVPRVVVVPCADARQRCTWPGSPREACAEIEAGCAAHGAAVRIGVGP